MGATGRCPFSRGLWICSVCLTGFLAYVCMAVQPAVTVPALVWSNQPLINGENGVDYEMLSQESFAQILFGGLLDLDTSKSSSQHWPFIKSSVGGHPEVIFAAIGDQLSGGILTQREHNDASGAPLSTMKSWLSTATSSITIPYIDVRSRRAPLASTVLASFKQSVKDAGKVGKVVALGECQLNDADVIKMNSVEELKNFLQSKPISKEVCEIILVLLCRQDKALDAEVARTEDVHLAVKESKLSYVAVYTSDPKYVAGLDTVTDTRALEESVEGNRSARTCDVECQTKATILEGVLAGIVLLLILISGIWCMSAIETPGRFEGPRES